MDSSTDIIIIFKPDRNSQHTLCIIIIFPWTLRPYYTLTSSNNNRQPFQLYSSSESFSTVCVCVLSCHPCSLQAPERASRPKQPPTLRSDLWQLLGWAISLFPYYSILSIAKNRDEWSKHHSHWRETAVNWPKGNQKFRMGTLKKVQKGRNRRPNWYMCQKNDTVQCNSEILHGPSICPEPDGLAVVICYCWDGNTFICLKAALVVRNTSDTRSSWYWRCVNDNLPTDDCELPSRGQIYTKLICLFQHGNWCCEG